MTDQHTATIPHSPQKENEAIQKLEAINQSEEQPILSIKAVFPFELFPNEVIIDKTKVTIIHKSFFFTRSFTSILIVDILNVTVNHSLLFGSLSLSDRYFDQEPMRIHYLWKEQAHQAASVIQGLILANKQNIDVLTISNEKLSEEVNKVGLPQATDPTTAI